MNDPRWHSGKAPTRDEILSELARISRRYSETLPSLIASGELKQVDADVRRDRVLAASDYIAAKWPREQQELGL